MTQNPIPYKQRHLELYMKPIHFQELNSGERKHVTVPNNAYWRDIIENPHIWFVDFIELHCRKPRFIFRFEGSEIQKNIIVIQFNVLLEKDGRDMLGTGLGG